MCVFVLSVCVHLVRFVNFQKTRGLRKRGTKRTGSQPHPAFDRPRQTLDAVIDGTFAMWEVESSQSTHPTDVTDVTVKL